MPEIANLYRSDRAAYNENALRYTLEYAIPDTD
jgi:hypothetical protein